MRLKSFFVIAFLFFVLYCSYLFATPTKVVIYPGGAKVIEEEKVSLLQDDTGTKIKLFLPATIIKGSFNFTILTKGLRVESTSIEETKGVKNKRIKALKSEIEKLEDKKNRIKSTLNSVEDLIKLWHKVLGSKLKTSLNIKSLTKNLKPLKELYAQKLILSEKLNRTIEEIKRLKQLIESATCGADRHREVTIFLKGKISNSKLKVRYSYLVKDCIHITPIYLIKAYPKRNLVKIDWNIKLTQSTGKDWQNIDLFFLTSKPYFKLMPYPVSPWIIYPGETVKRSKSLGIFMAKAPVGEKKSEFQKPKKERFLFDIYSLGKVSVLAGETKTFFIRKFVFNSKFYHLIRPLEEQKAYVYARSKTKKRIRIPEGSALFFVDGEFVGRRNSFSVYGTKLNLFFGPDPEVNVKRVLVEKGSGKKGIILGKKTYKWLWKILITNKKSKRINVVLELPYPQKRDERIKVELLGDKNLFNKENNVLKTELQIKPQNTKTIFYGVKITYPKELNVWWNRF